MARIDDKMARIDDKTGRIDDKMARIDDKSMTNPLFLRILYKIIKEICLILKLFERIDDKIRYTIRYSNSKVLVK